MKYIYIFEDGAFLKSDKEPDEADFDAVDRGLLTVIRVSDQTVLGGDGAWEEMESFE